jgi:hypothetical protein
MRTAGRYSPTFTSIHKSPEEKRIYRQGRRNDAKTHAVFGTGVLVVSSLICPPFAFMGLVLIGTAASDLIDGIPRPKDRIASSEIWL